MAFDRQPSTEQGHFGEEQMNRREFFGVTSLVPSGLTGWPRIIASMASFAATDCTVAHEFYVAPNGNDANPGTKSKPFASIIKARDMAREVSRPNRIWLAPGRYFNQGSIVLDERDSGLTIKGDGSGATAEVYGGVPVTGWERWKVNIWRAPVPKRTRFFNLIVDGKPATMAQTPNLGSGYCGGAQMISEDAISVPAAWRAYDFSDAQVAAFIGSGWFNEMRAVYSAQPDDKGVLKIDRGVGEMNPDRFIVRGVLEFLDEPGEWCLKHDEGYVYYLPKSGQPADHVIVRPTAERLLDIHGSSQWMPARDIKLENLSLIGSDFCLNWRLFPPDKTNSVPEELREGLIFGENVEGLKVSGCRILAAGHSGLFLNHYAQNCVIENCLIVQAGVNGIFLNGWDVGDGPFQSTLESYVNKGHRIENNFIYDCGKFIPTAAGIEMYQSGDTLITRNEIAQQARCAIMLRGVRWGMMPKEQYGRKLTFADYFDCIHTRDIKIIGNDIHNVCRNTDDFGAIESWGVGCDNLWENNDIHDIDHPNDWDSWGHALFPDDSSHYTSVRGNIIHHVFGGRLTGAIMLKNIGEVIENNVVVDCLLGRLVTFAPFIEPAWNMTLTHNIFVVDGVDERYDINQYTFTGMSSLGVKIPEGATGFQTADYNWITPRDPSNPNPLANDKIDLHSTFGPAPVKKLKPDWDITAADYQITSPKWFTPINTSKIGLRKDFPFDTLAVTRRGIGEIIQAEDYQRQHELRTSGGVGIYAMSAGSWAKYANIDFGSGSAAKAIFALEAPKSNSNPPKPFIRRYGLEAVEEIPFKGDGSVETIPAWEISNLYTELGKTGRELFNEPFPPETDIKAGEWSPYLAPVTSRQGITSKPGVVDFFVAKGEESRNACAYARASVWAQRDRYNATMTVSAANGVKVWLNGELIISADNPGTYSETKRCNIKAGWNTILVKVNQGANAGDVWFKLGMVASSCGHIVSLPGLPTDERTNASTDGILELRLDSPLGRRIGVLKAGQTSCAITRAAGIHNLYLVFPGNDIHLLNWFQFETGGSEILRNNRS
jgi:hypothetical protein